MHCVCKCSVLVKCIVLVKFSVLIKCIVVGNVQCVGKVHWLLKFVVDKVLVVGKCSVLIIALCW